MGKFKRLKAERIVPLEERMEEAEDRIDELEGVIELLKKPAPDVKGDETVMKDGKLKHLDTTVTVEPLQKAAPKPKAKTKPKAPKESEEEE
jgi:hypothetical protein